MRHAYMIMAHSEFELLIKLIQMLDNVNNDIYVHVDKKIKDVPRDKIINAVKKSQLYFYREYEIYWGCYSQTECEIFLMDKAHEKEYDYYHLLSGTDLPLVSQEEMHSFFEAHAGTEYVFIIEPQINDEYYSWYHVYHPFQRFLRISNHEFVNKLFWLLEGIVVKVQLIVGIDRVKDKKTIFQKGANWFSITNDLVECVLKKKEWIRKVFSFTRSSDEMFLQTVLINSQYADNMVYPKFECQPGYINIRFIDWKRGRPYTFRESDYDELMESGCLFARKFSQVTDPGIIDKIYVHVMGDYSI